MDYTTILIYLTAGIAVMLPPLYWWASQGRWWRDQLGIHLMAFMTVQAIVFTAWARARFLRDTLGATPDWFFDWVVLGSFTLMPLILAWRGWELILAGRDARRYPEPRR